MRAEIIALGLASPGMENAPGDVTRLGEYLAELGMELGSIMFIRSREREMEEGLKQAMKRSVLVIITSATPWGPASTPASGRDDLVKKTLSRLLDRRLILQGELLRAIEKRYQKRYLDIPKGFDKMALLPNGAKAVLEDAQAAPTGYFLEHGGRYIYYAPGLLESPDPHVPEELAGLLTRGRTLRRWERNRVLRTYGLDEAKLAETLKGADTKHATLITAASLSGIDIRVKVKADVREKAEALLDETCSNIKDKLGDYFYAEGSEGMEEVVATLLTDRKLKVAVAESCTGGLVAKRLTDVPGSTAYMDRGVVTYSNRSKEELLDVPAKTIAEHGAVSRETAQAMAEGIRWNAKSDLGLSVTGIAGPSGGTLAKPVGLVYIGLATPDGVSVKGYNFPGGRDAIRVATSQRALDTLRRYLIS